MPYDLAISTLEMRRQLVGKLEPENVADSIGVWVIRRLFFHRRRFAFRCRRRLYIFPTLRLPGTSLGLSRFHRTRLQTSVSSTHFTYIRPLAETLVEPFADCRIDGGVDDRLVEIDDEDEALLGEQLDAGFEGDLVCLLGVTRRMSLTSAGGRDGAYVVGYFDTRIVVRDFDALVYALVRSC